MDISRLTTKGLAACVGGMFARGWLMTKHRSRHLCAHKDHAVQ